MNNNQTKRALDRLKCSGLAEAFLLPGEDPNEFHDFCEQVLLEYRPCGPSEEACALSIAKPLWRKLRPHPSARMGRGDRSDRGLDAAHNSTAATRVGFLAYYAKPPTEAQTTKIIGELLDEHRKKTGVVMPDFYLKALRADHEYAAELDALISDALNQMVELKQMQRRAG